MHYRVSCSCADSHKLTLFTCVFLIILWFWYLDCFGFVLFWILLSFIAYTPPTCFLAFHCATYTHTQHSRWTPPAPAHAPAPFDRCSSNKLAKLFTGWLHFWYYAACLASLWLAVCAAAAPHCHGPHCAEVSSGCLAMFRFASLCCASLPPLLRCTSWLQAPLLLCSQLELALWPISR